MRKYVIIGFDNEYRTFVKTEEELREWAEEVRQNENLQDVTPDFTEKEWTQDHTLYDEYVYNIDLCIEFLEGYDWEIIEIKNL
tara:strand:- start:1771 stop:2019 length:249 start_codon:yes stop_codon:yes gene_type:complete